jgi:hypothetical protein
LLLLQPFVFLRLRGGTAAEIPEHSVHIYSMCFSVFSFRGRFVSAAVWCKKRFFVQFLLKKKSRACANGD